MCGIVGVIGRDNAASEMLEALKRLEYRGYDSAGVATLNSTGLERRRAAGKLFNLEKELEASPLSGEIGIGHTRWATHGAPTSENAHPHVIGRVAVVHNGIIENHLELRAELEKAGAVFESETDTEVVAHMIDQALKNGVAPAQAMSDLMTRVTGAFAFVVLIEGEEDLLLAARRASPLAIGYGQDQMFIGSDAMALATLTQRIAYLEDGDWAVVTRAGADIRDQAGQPVSRDIKTSEVAGAMIGKGNYRHFMQKEIYEQPEVIGRTLFHDFSAVGGAAGFPDFQFNPATLSRLTIIAAGTSYYAGVVAKYWFESVARLPVEVDIASEFRYREAPMPEGGAALFISQSGESLDTLMALRYAREQGQHIVALVNVAESSIARESDTVLATPAGPEVGVASTKTTSAQLVTLARLAMNWAEKRGVITPDRKAEMAAALETLPSKVAEILKQDRLFDPIAHELAKARDILYLGRGSSFPIAMEGALKLKEISYIHAEGYAAGEMKHGPIALIDEGVPIVMVAPFDELFEKTASNMQEARSRGGSIVLLSDRKGIEVAGKDAIHCFEMPECDPFVSPILYLLPVQMLSYCTAVEKGTDVDQPRNLAKSVTVE